MNPNIFKKILANGLTVLVRPIHNIPKVSIQLWYGVGSKDESSSEKGLAHLLEHMIFKGTEKLSESDINLITNKLSGYCNAFTSYDYTGYLFDFPSQNWHESLAILADCMRNCTFKEDLLNSELKAVIQELKLYRDDYGSSLVEKMLVSMFPGDPYQHPIIGYKHDLWGITRENLLNFYNKNYIPNNATLVIVGDVKTEEVFELAEKNFGHISPNWEHKHKEFYLEKDVSATETVLYRDIQQPTVITAFVMPGAKQKVDFYMDALALILAEGRDSRLHKRLINKEDLVTDISAYSYDLFDHEILFIQFEPKQHNDIDKIIGIIKEEISKLKTNSFNDEELQRAIKKVEAGFLSILEDNQKQAYAIGKFYLATKDENHIFKYIEHDKAKLKKELDNLAESYLHSTLMHVGKVMPLKKEDINVWQKIQKESDEVDNIILSKKIRDNLVEPGVKVNKINPAPYPKFEFPKYTLFTLKNGLEVLAYENNNLPKVDLILELKARHYYDSDELEGISNFVSEMLLEGTKKYSSEELAKEVEILGMSIKTAPGYVSMSMLSSDLKRGLEILEDILTNSVFDEKNIEKVRAIILAEIKNYWDNPSDFSGHIIRQKIYKGHPYRKNILGSAEIISKITRKDLLDYYKKYISPKSARLAIVGDFDISYLKALFNQTLDNWNGPEVKDINFPTLNPEISDVDYKINRDQVLLAFVCRSISRLDPDFDKILVFDQIFGGGVLGTMSSRLFQIREQSGLFYGISGSFLAGTDDQPGMFIVKTKVSNDRLQEAEKLIATEIKNATKEITDEELSQAKNALINSRVDNFASNKQTASSFLFLRKYNLPQDYFDKRVEQILNVSKKDIIDAVDRILKEPMFKLRIGRI